MKKKEKELRLRTRNIDNKLPRLKNSLNNWENNLRQKEKRHWLKKEKENKKKKKKNSVTSMVTEYLVDLVRQQQLTKNSRIFQSIKKLILKVHSITLVNGLINKNKLKFMLIINQLTNLLEINQQMILYN